MTQDYKQIIRARLSEERYAHSLAVAEEAVSLAKRYGADPDKAYTAGLLHDIMKDAGQNEVLQYLDEFDILLSKVERHEPKLWHAIAGAGYIRCVLRIEDPDILNAVRYHTTARAGMSLPEKVLYLADFTSADRDYNGVDDMRAAVSRSMEEAMEIALRFTLRDLAGRGRAIHPDTLEAYNEIIMAKINR